MVHTLVFVLLLSSGQPISSAEPFDSVTACEAGQTTLIKKVAQYNVTAPDKVVLIASACTELKPAPQGLNG